MQWNHKCSNDNVLLGLGPSWSPIPICPTFVINNSPTYSMLVSHQSVVFGRTFHKIPLPTLDTGRKKLTLLLKSPASFPVTLLISFGYFVYILTDMFIVVQAFHFKPSFYSLFEYFGHKQIKFIFCGWAIFVTIDQGARSFLQNEGSQEGSPHFILE